MKKHFTLFTLLLVMFSAFSFAQKNKNLQVGLVPENLKEMNRTKEVTPTESLKDLFKAISGTYQIQVSDTNYKVLMSRPLFNLIAENRLKDSDVTLNLDDKSVLFIPSYKKIENSNFKKLKLSIYKTKQ